MSINLNLNFKARIYETPVGCQCWRSCKRTKDKHLALEMGWLGKIVCVFTLCLKKRHWCSVAHYNFNAHQPILVFLAEALPRECAIKWWLVIPPFLTYVSALHGETRTPEIMSFQSCCIPCLNDTAFGTCCRLRLLLGRKSVHCSVASQLAERSRLRAKQYEVARHCCWTRAALSANVLLVADGVRCLKTGLHWAVLRRAGGKIGRQILRWWVSKI